MTINPPVMADFHHGRVDKTDAGTPPAPESAGIYQQGKQCIAHQFPTPLVTDRCGEILAHMNAPIPLVIPLKTAVAGMMKQHNDGHHFA